MVVMRHAHGAMASAAEVAEAVAVQVGNRVTGFVTGVILILVLVYLSHFTGDFGKVN